MTISFQYIQNKVAESHTRSIACTSYKQEKVAEQAFNIVIKATLQKQLPVAFLGISAGKFVKAKGSENFKNFFKVNANDQSTLTLNSMEESCQDPEIEKSADDEIDFGEDSKLDEKNKKIETLISESSEKSEFFEPHSKKNLNRKSSPCSKIKKSLRTDNFKKSFFMNILKEKQPDKSNDSSSSNKTEISTESDHIEEDSGFNIDDDINKSNNETVSENSFDTIPQSSNSTIKSTNAIDKLKEIFPDLNDIDPSVVKLLPLELQEEAKKLLKESNVTESYEKNEEFTKAKDKEIIKQSRGRPKLKPGNQKSKIQNFFIKTDVNNSSNEFKKCPECDQLISVSKFEEHKDYHIARNLQREMNQITNGVDVRKRKALDQIPSRPKKRNSDEIVYNIPKPECVTSLFQR